MTSHYDAAYYLKKVAMPEAAYAILSNARARKIQPYIKPSDRVFEFGVGSGLNLASLVCGARHGSDINPSSNEIARQHGVEIIDSLGRIDDVYDVVICHHVLEHLTAPADCLVSLRPLLRVGGTLLLFVPYEKGWRYRKHIATDDNHHLYSWTPHTLANLAIECGFNLQSAALGMFGYDRISARLATALRVGDVGFRILRKCAHLIHKEHEVCVIATRPA
jgi:SAM-dependent methyltransferase